MKKILYLFIIQLVAACSPEVPTPSKKALFSVAEGEKVTFAPSNLQYIVSQDKWQFAEHPWSYRGIANLSKPDTVPYFSTEWYSKDNALSDTIDLFCWGADAELLPSEEEAYIKKDFIDWGDFIQDKNAKWRTLTSDEWEYLLTERKNANKLYGVAEVNGVGGIVLLPDGWTQPAQLNVEFIPGWYGYGGTGAWAAHQTFNKRQWHILQQSGAVFLPAAGKRGYTFSHITDQWDLLVVKEIQTLGNYWTKDLNIYGEPMTFSFKPNKIQIYSNEAFDGSCVRLVKDK